MATVLKDYPQAHWHQYDPVAGDGERLGLRQATGTAGNAVYHLDKADVVVSLDADFLGAGPSMVRYTRDFTDRRRVTKESTGMNRLYAVESSPTLTGIKAEHRLPLRASDIEGFSKNLAAAVGASGGQAGASSPLAEKWIAAVSKDLQAHRGRSVVMAGDYQPAAVHALAHAMNQALGNIGTTVTYGAAIEPNPISQHASLAELATAMDAGQVQVLVILGNNPVFTAPAELKFAERLGKVSLVVYHSLYLDETSEFAHWNIPDTHPLETWGDPRAYDGTVTLMQPLIAPLYDAHSAHEVLATLTALRGRKALEIVKDYWTRAFGGATGWNVRNADGNTFGNADAFWKAAVHDGFIRGTATAGGGQATPFKAPAARSARSRSAPRSRRCSGSNACGSRSTCRGSGRGRDSGCAGASDRSGGDARARDRLPPRSQRLGRPLRQQRLAAGSAEADHQADVGHGGVGQPQARPGQLAHERRHHRASLPWRDGPHAGLRRSRAARRVSDGLPRLRPPHVRPCRHGDRGGAAVQRLQAAHVRRAVVRHRPRRSRRLAIATCWRRRRTTTRWKAAPRRASSRSRSTRTNRKS